jgi:hypothetical protein
MIQPLKNIGTYFTSILLLQKAGPSTSRSRRIGGKRWQL